VEVTGVAWVSPQKLHEYEMTAQVRWMMDERLAEWLTAFAR
jgi:hypothetical protein